MSASEESGAAAPRFEPLYRQVRQILQDRIASGDWPPGSLLPAEPKLAESLGVSPGTVRKALDSLALERLVVRQQGRGTFVAAQTPDSSLFRFFSVVGEDGEQAIPDSRELGREVGAATTEERRRLALSGRARVLRLDRVRPLAGRDALVERVVLPLALFPGLEREESLPNTLYDHYQHRYGITIRRADETLRAASAGGRVARVLGIKPGTPLLAIDRVAISFDDKPVEWRVSLLDTRFFAYRNVLR
ncbi:MAG: GntR family transcriptional regulator [Kiloniellales bacterium]|nr:GntR family transcriptional regulator [Kiloniellales bacterium]